MRCSAMTVEVLVDEGQVRRRIRRAGDALRGTSWTVDELRPFADLLEAILSARQRVDAVGHVAWLADRRNG